MANDEPQAWRSTPRELGKFPAALGAVFLLSAVLAGGPIWFVVIGTLLLSYGISTMKQHAAANTLGSVLLWVVAVRQVVVLLIATVMMDPVLMCVAAAPLALTVWFTRLVQRQLRLIVPRADLGDRVAAGQRKEVG